MSAQPDAHAGAGAASRALCDAIVGELRRRDATAERKPATRTWCPFHRQGHADFAFVRHNKRSASVQVWCIGDPDRLRSAAAKAGLRFEARTKDNTDWARRFPGSIFVSDPAMVVPVVSLLLDECATFIARSDAARSHPTTLPQEIDPTAEFWEGAKSSIAVDRYERDRRARDACLNAHGLRCTVCGFDFEVTYGASGRGVIQVHHLVPLSQVGPGYRVNGRRDLIPICANCHVMVHVRRPTPYTPDEVRAMRAAAHAPSDPCHPMS